VLLAFCVGVIAIAGNAAIAPAVLGQTAIYAGVILIVLLALADKVRLVRLLLWAAQQRILPTPPGFVKAQVRWITPRTNAIRKAVIRWIRRSRREPVVFFTATDDISALVRALTYVQQVSASLCGFKVRQLTRSPPRTSLHAPESFSCTASRRWWTFPRSSRPTASSWTRCARCAALSSPY
jgi:hypothetical protein